VSIDRAAYLPLLPLLMGHATGGARSGARYTAETTEQQDPAHAKPGVNPAQSRYGEQRCDAASPDAVSWIVRQPFE
jgi:hypothetical protein